MAETKQHDLRLAALRERLVSQQLDGWFVGREDMYQGEEVQAGDERLAFLCGFNGSAGFGLVLRDSAALFSDGRYTLQMANQTNQTDWTTHTMPEETLATWLKGISVSGLTIGVDKKLVTLDTFDRLARTFGEAGATLLGMMRQQPARRCRKSCNSWMPYYRKLIARPFFSAVSIRSTG
jgi:Xaa-Pro aminopeptidase